MGYEFDSDSTFSLLDAIPTPDDQAHAAARAYVARHAPDCLDALGLDS